MNSSLACSLSNDEACLKVDRPRPTGTCPICQTIAGYVVSKLDEEFGKMDLATWEAIEMQDCITCQKIVQHHARTMDFRWEPFQPSCLIQLKSYNDEFSLFPNSCNELLPHGENKYHRSVIMLPSQISGEVYRRYVPADKRKIDIDRLVKWPSLCDQSHSGSCHDLPQWHVMPPASSLILIDVQDHCLTQVSGQITCQYVALSYVWGKLPGSIKLTTENLSQLCTKNSLLRQNHWLNIPKTISDAIYLTSAMGLRYLWIDRLCIVQNDPAHLNKQLQQMAQIYANSYFTIIALDGDDADYGLPGVDPDFSPRSLDEITFEFSPDVIMIPMPEREEISRERTWHTRAWTFQERAVSPRTLVFTGNTVYWQCQKAKWFECYAEYPPGLAPDTISQDHGAWPSYSLSINPWPDLKQFFQVVNGFNNRLLSFESDALRAFMAITSAMSKTFPGGFHFGLPTFLFDVAMMWTPDNTTKRRSDFPSWSWLGWAGDVYLIRGYRAAWNPVPESPLFHVDIHPLVKWHMVHQDGKSHSPVDNSYHHHHKESLNDPEYTSSHGWINTFNDTEYKIFQDPANVGFQHESLRGRPFDFPFPVHHVASEDISHTFSTLLTFKAESCTLFLGRSLGRDEEAGSLLHMNLLDKGDSWAGIIHSPFVHEDQGAPCELVAVSRGKVGWDTLPRKDKPFVPFLEMVAALDIPRTRDYEFYNVLWIEWVDKIAYRKSCGRVCKDAWEKQDRKIVDVVLG